MMPHAPQARLWYDKHRAFLPAPPCLFPTPPPSCCAPQRTRQSDSLVRTEIAANLGLRQDAPPVSTRPPTRSTQHQHYPTKHIPRLSAHKPFWPLVFSGPGAGSCGAQAEVAARRNAFTKSRLQEDFLDGWGGPGGSVDSVRKGDQVVKSGS